MKTASCLLQTLVMLAILPACSKKPVDVTGQIFVVTKSRENIKMGGLVVRVISDTEFQTVARATLPWMQEEVRKQAQSMANADYLAAFTKEVMEMEEAAAIPIPELAGIRSDVSHEFRKADDMLVSELNDGLLKRAIRKLIDGATSEVSVSTDADGRFTVPITVKTWFLAAGEREVGNETEEYIWVKAFEPVGEPTSATMTISNEADIGSEDRLYSVLTNAIGTQDGLAGFRKVEVSDKAKELVARYREAANDAKLKAEHVAAESKEKLTTEISSRNPGASATVTFAGQSVMTFVYCPAGSFIMGSPLSDKDRSTDENQVKVALTKGFWMAKTEVTQNQWQAVMGSNPSSIKGGQLPVESVSWDDAQEFLQKVNGSGLIPDGWKMTLPTEAQWEYSCRAGETGLYSGGTIDEVAWYIGNSGRKAHEVGTKKPNGWGLYDMHGNVLEWCFDLYDGRLVGGSDPKGPNSGELRVFRGGSWDREAYFCRAAERSRRSPDRRGNLCGFRTTIVPSE